MSYLDRVRACQIFDPTAYRPFRVDGRAVGRVPHAFAERLAEFPDVFRVSAEAVELAPELAGPGTRTTAVEAVLRSLAPEGWFRGWRDEPYPVALRFGAAPLLLLERATVPRFGVRGYGLHVNGFVRDGAAIAMWIGTRAADRRVDPGKLDQLVAGGQPAGLSLAENLRKEAAEEAALGEELAARARAASVITYRTERPEGLREDVVFVYDLELPADFRPRNTDGEIARFELMPLDEVAAIVRETDAFKFNCSLVVIDFLLRHGRLDPDEATDVLGHADEETRSAVLAKQALDAATDASVAPGKVKRAKSAEVPSATRNWSTSL